MVSITCIYLHAHSHKKFEYTLEWKFNNRLNYYGLAAHLWFTCAAMDDTQRMMQMGGFGMDPTKVCSSCCLVWHQEFDRILYFFYEPGIWSLTSIDMLTKIHDRVMLIELKKLYSSLLKVTWQLCGKMMWKVKI